MLGGDGSMEEGALYEAAVIARSLDLPVMFLIENNEWSMATRIDERRRPIDLSHFAKPPGCTTSTLLAMTLCITWTLEQLRTSCLGRRESVILEVDVTTLGDWRRRSHRNIPRGNLSITMRGRHPNSTCSSGH